MASVAFGPGSPDRGFRFGRAPERMPGGRCFSSDGLEGRRTGRAIQPRCRARGRSINAPDDPCCKTRRKSNPMGRTWHAPGYWKRLRCGGPYITKFYAVRNCIWLSARGWSD
ncbi:hypothetical protein [Azospirillum melinis]